MAELAADDALQTRLLGLSPGGASVSQVKRERRRRASTGFRSRCSPPLALARAAAGRQPVDLGDADVAGLAMGMMIFVMASGLTLVFGLMDVLNFGHGAFIAVGAYVAAIAVLLPLAAWRRPTASWPISRRCCRRCWPRWRWPALLGWSSSASSSGRSTAST